MPSIIKNKKLKCSGPKDNLSTFLSNERFKKNPWVHIFNQGEKVALYNPLSQDVIYGSESLMNLFDCFRNPIKPFDLKPDDNRLEVIKKMIDLDIIVNETYDDQKELECLQEAVREKFQISLMYLVLSNKCNYNCDYCFVTKDKLKISRKLDQKTISDSYDMLIRLIGKEESSAKVVLYGGEPLINEDLIKFAIGEERKRIESEKGVAIEFEMITNGSLITKQLSTFFAKERVNISVSLDGWEEIHNKQRKTKSGNGTFRESVRGFQLLKEAGCEPGISCTISYHNIDNLNEIVSYFAEKLKPSAI